MIKVAICGNIASGKTEAQKIIEDMNYPVLDTDKVSHSILEEHSSVIITTFSGYDILENNHISREKLGMLVFNNTNLKTKLENVVHPIVKDKIMQFFSENNDKKYAFVAIPLLFEANMQDIFDKIIFIYSNDDIRLKRLLNRNNYDEEYAKIRINSQLSQDIKASKADYVIYNNESLNNLKNELIKLIL